MVEQDRRRVRRRLAAGGVLMAIGAIVLLIAGTGGRDEEGGPVPQGGSRFAPAAGTEGRGLLDVLGPVLRPAEASAAGLPPELAVAQLFAVGFRGTEPPAELERRVRSRGLGAVVVGGTNYLSPGQLRGVRTALARAAKKGDRIPPIVAADPAELGDLGPPPARELGVDRTTAEVTRATRSAAKRVRGAGVQLVLSPPADLRVSGGAAENRAFSDDPGRAADLVRASVRGWEDERVAPAPGRFPGEGAASQDPLLGPAAVGLPLDQLKARDVRPFGAVAEWAPAVQMSAAVYAAWDGVTPATLEPAAVALLRRDLKFGGVVVSADLIAATAPGSGGVARAAVDAVKAGCDLLVVRGGRGEQEAAYRAVLGAVRRGEISEERLAESVKRVERLKAEVTARPKPKPKAKPKPRPESSAQERRRSRERREREPRPSQQRPG